MRDCHTWAAAAAVKCDGKMGVGVSRLSFANYCIKLDRMSPIQSKSETVAGDLQTISEILHHSNTPNEDKIRLLSTPMRRLLIDDDFGRSWRESGFTKQPIIPTFSIRRFLAHPSFSDLELVLAGGGKRDTDSDGCRAFTLSRSPIDYSIYEPGKKKQNRIYLELVNYRIDNYLKSPCIAWHKTIVSRQILIQWAANHRGGAHYNEHSSPHSSGPKQILFDTIDDLASHLTLHGLTAPLYQLLSLAQELVAAPDVLRFCAHYGVALFDPQDTAE